MNKQQVKTRDEGSDAFAPIFEWAADRKVPHNRKDVFLHQDDARNAYDVDVMQFFGDIKDVYKLHSHIDATRIWTVHEAEDYQYWVSGTSSFVNRMGYYVAAKPVPSNTRIVTSSQCVYCDREECVCVKCPTCELIEDHCRCNN